MIGLALAGLALGAPLGSAEPDPPSRSSSWLALLPDGETKRKFLLDCTGCHQFDHRIARPGGRPRTKAQWVEAVTRMLGYAGATTSFPVISADREPTATAAWLARHLPAGPVPDPPLPPVAKATITEYPMPEPQDLPHDLVVEPSGSVLVTGMFTHRLYRVSPEGGTPVEIPIPVEKANPRAIDRDRLGRVWAVLGGPNKLAMLPPDSAWQVYDVGMYPHSLAIASDGKVWVNGHFTRAPELIGAVDPATGRFETHEVPGHPTLAAGPGGPVPYEIRSGPDGRIWQSELQGNRMVAFSPATGRFQVFPLPTPFSGPRRFDVDAEGIVWIPAYATGRLVRLDPATGRFTEIPLPVADALPYVVRADPGDGALWIGTGAADLLFRYDPRSRRFETYPLGTEGAMVRHLAVDPRSHAVWLAYGASPGIAARVARVLPPRRPDSSQARAAVREVLDRLTRAMRTRDTALLRSAFEPGARLTGMRPREGAAALQALTVQQFADFLARDTRAPWTERLWNPEIRLDGTLATVWAEYDFHFGSRFSHCGTDAFQLLDTADGWKIVALADTYRTGGCPSRPAPE